MCHDIMLNIAGFKLVCFILVAVYIMDAYHMPYFRIFGAC